MHHTLASFDIVNLYTNVPINDVLEIVKTHLYNNPTLLIESANEILSLLKEVLKQNYFTFNGNFYSQPDGLSMGSPLSAILSDIYLNHIENKFIFSDLNKFKNKIILYNRYVDDTIMLFNGSTRQLNLLLNYLNSIAPKLQFTIETEDANKINFLDMTIEKKDNKLCYSVYRKPTSSNQTIHATSYHPISHKLAAYNSLVNRMLNFPLSTTDYNRELNIIKQIAVSNGYKQNMIDKLVSKFNNNTQNNKLNVTGKSEKKFICIEYSQTAQNGLHKMLKNTDSI